MILPEIAVALKVANPTLAEMSMALWFQAETEAERARRLATISARIGLSVNAATRIVSEEGRHAALIRLAFLIMRALIPHERELMSLIDDPVIRALSTETPSDGVQALTAP